MKFSISYPLRPFVVTQQFGVNGDYYRAHGVNIIGHNGLDLQAYHGQPIYAAHDGVAFYEVDGSAGYGVVLVSQDKWDYLSDAYVHQVSFKTIYWHLCDSTLEPQFKSPIEGNSGIFLKRGDLIGYADNTGLSTGDHLHFGLKPVLSSDEPPFVWASADYANGYLGAIDPTMYFDGTYVGEANTLSPVTQVFSRNMSRGDVSCDIQALQTRLQSMGYFPIGQQTTQFYGPITQSAVYAFQLDHVQMNWVERNIYRGWYCGQKTRAALNTV